jgi:hypothetical protein
MKYLFSLMILTVITFSCQKSDCKDAVEAKFVDKTGFDGCGMVIEVLDNEFIEPTNLAEFDISPKDGMKIWVSYKLSENSASICMIGEIVDIICIQER